MFVSYLEDPLDDEGGRRPHLSHAGSPLASALHYNSITPKTTVNPTEEVD